MVVFIIYLALGYWAVNKVMYANKVVIYNDGFKFFMQRVVYGAFLGWALIPIALIKKMIGK